MLANPILCVLLVLTIAPLGLAQAADVALGEKLEFRRVEPQKAADFAPLRSSWGVVRDIDEAVEACLRTGFIEDAQVARAGGGKVLTIEPDGTEVEIEIIGGAGGGGSATPAGRMIDRERRRRVNALLLRLGLKLPSQTLILLPPQGGYRVHEIRLCPVTKEKPRRLVVDVRPPHEQPADEVVIVPRAIPADVLVEFVNGEDNDRHLATIGGEVSSGPLLPAGE